VGAGLVAALGAALVAGLRGAALAGFDLADLVDWLNADFFAGDFRAAVFFARAGALDFDPEERRARGDLALAIG
jgi:hypothetical protein